MNVLRSVLVPVLLAVAGLFTLTSNAAVWANRTVFDEDTFVTTANRALDDKDVQEELAQRLSAILVEQANVQGRLESELPPRLTVLAPVLTREVRELAYSAALRLLNNEAARRALDASLRLVHAQTMRVIEGEGAIVVKEDVIVLDTMVLLRQLAAELDIGTDIDLGLPPDAGQIVLLEDAHTANAVQELISLHDTITWLVIGIALASFALALLLSRTRRETLRTAGIVLVGVGLLAMLLLFPIRPIVNAIADDPTAIRATIQAFTLDYRIQSLVIVLIGALVIIAAILLGDGELARATRGSLRPRAGEPAADLGTAVRSNGRAMRAAGLVTAALLLVAWPEPSTRVYLTILAALVGYFALLWLVSDEGSWAEAARERIRSAMARASGNDSFAGRHAWQLRLAGIGAAGLVLMLLPGVGFGAVVAAVAFVLAYLACIDWLASRA